MSGRTTMDQRLPGPFHECATHGTLGETGHEPRRLYRRSLVTFGPLFCCHNGSLASSATPAGESGPTCHSRAASAPPVSACLWLSTRPAPVSFSLVFLRPRPRRPQPRARRPRTDTSIADWATPSQAACAIPAASSYSAPLSRVPVSPPRSLALSSTSSPRVLLPPPASCAVLRPASCAVPRTRPLCRRPLPSPATPLPITTPPTPPAPSSPSPAPLPRAFSPVFLRPPASCVVQRPPEFSCAVPRTRPLCRRPLPSPATPLPTTSPPTPPAPSSPCPAPRPRAFPPLPRASSPRPPASFSVLQRPPPASCVLLQRPAPPTAHRTQR